MVGLPYRTVWMGEAMSNLRLLIKHNPDFETRDKIADHLQNFLRLNRNLMHLLYRRNSKVNSATYTMIDAYIDIGEDMLELASMNQIHDDPVPQLDRIDKNLRFIVDRVLEVKSMDEKLLDMHYEQTETLNNAKEIIAQESELARQLQNEGFQNRDFWKRLFLAAGGNPEDKNRVELQIHVLQRVDETWPKAAGLLRGNLQIFGATENRLDILHQSFKSLRHDFDRQRRKWRFARRRVRFPPVVDLQQLAPGGFSALMTDLAKQLHGQASAAKVTRQHKIRDAEEASVVLLDDFLIMKEGKKKWFDRWKTK